MAIEIVEAGRPELIGEGLVDQDLVSRFGKRARVVVAHAHTRFVDREACCRPLRRHHRELPGKRIQHLDRETTDGTTWDPCEICRRMRQPTGALTGQSAEIDGVSQPRADCC